MEEDGHHQDVCVFTPHLVLMARRVGSSASFRQMVDVRCRFEPERCDAWHLHFLAVPSHFMVSTLICLLELMMPIRFPPNGIKPNGSIYLMRQNEKR